MLSGVLRANSGTAADGFLRSEQYPLRFDGFLLGNNGPQYDGYLRPRRWAFTSETVEEPGGAVEGSASQTLGGVTQSASGKVRIAGTATQSLGAVTQSAAANLRIAGTASQTLGTVTQAASAAIRIAGAASQTLAAVTQAATGTTGTAQEEFTGLGPGWGNYRLEWRDRKWVKRKEREDELASLIRQVYAELSGETPAQVIADEDAAPAEKAAAKAAQTLAPFKDGSGINWEALAANAAAVARVEDALEAYLQARDEEDEVLLLVAA